MKRVSSITEGAMLLALFAVMTLITAYIPLAGVITLLVYPIIFILYTIRHHLKAALLLLLASVFLTAILGQVAMIPQTFSFCLSGLVMGYFYKKKKSGTAIAAGGIAYLFGFVLIFGSYALFLNLFPKDGLGPFVDDAIKQAVPILKQFGQEMDAKKVSQLKEQMTQMIYLIPASFAMGGALYAFITHWIASAVLKRMNMAPKKLLPFREWKLPRSIVWYYLIVIVLGMMNLEKGSYPYLAVLNLSALLQLLLVIQGLSFVYYFFHKKGYSAGLPIMVTIFTILIPFLLQLVRILGIIDLGFALRAKIKGSSN